MDLSDRIKEIRKLKKLSQTAFGEKLGVSRDVINNAENGRSAPNDLFIQHLCEIYSVNEEWLRNGTGETFKQDEKTILAQLATEFRLDDLDRRIIESYLQMGESQRKAIKDYIKSLSAAAASEMDAAEIDTEVESYRRELQEEKSTQTSEASRNTGGNAG